MKLKICQIIPTLLQGGSEQQMTLLVSDLDSQQFDRSVIVLTQSGPLEVELRQSGVQVHVAGRRCKADPTALVRLTRLLRQISPDIVHTWRQAANTYGRVAATCAGVPCIVASQRSVDFGKTPLEGWVDRLLLRNTNCITTNSTAIADFYTQRNHPRKLFEVIPNAVPSNQGQLERDELFRRLNLPPRKYLVGAIGRLSPQKGLPDLIWAAELLRVAIPDVWLVIVGDGPQMRYLQRVRDQYGSQDAVRFVGHRPDAKELLTAMDLIWNGSHHEGQSNTILEAMAAGVPVIATDIPGNRDLVVNQETGYLYPLGDVNQLVRVSTSLLIDPPRRAEIGQRARQHVQQKHSVEQMVTGYSQLYLELAGRAKLPV